MCGKTVAATPRLKTRRSPEACFPRETFWGGRAGGRGHNYCTAQIYMLGGRGVDRGGGRGVGRLRGSEPWRRGSQIRTGLKSA